MSKQNMALILMAEAAGDGIKVAGPDTLAGRRLADMRDFYAYMLSEMPVLIDRWAARRASDTALVPRGDRGQPPWVIGSVSRRELRRPGGRRTRIVRSVTRSDPFRESAGSVGCIRWVRLVRRRRL